VISLQSYKFDKELLAKKYETISSLKIRIAEILNIDVNHFIMKKHNHNGVEVKNLYDKIESMTLSNMNIYLQLGSPPSECNIIINIKHNIYCI